MNLPLEKQVNSLELAKRLKELGVKQESYFHWAGYEDMSGTQTWEVEHNPHCGISAFTVAELGELLPGNVEGMYFVHQWGFMHNQAYTTAKNIQSGQVVAEFCADTEADARAKTLVHLLENKLLTL